MPRALPTQSAVHEALQRRANERPGDSFSGELVGGLLSFFAINQPDLNHFARGPSSRRIHVLAAERAAVKASYRPCRLDSRSSCRDCCIYASAGRCACRLGADVVLGRHQLRYAFG